MRKAFLIKAIFVIVVIFVILSSVFAQTTNTNEGFLDRFYNQQQDVGRGFWGIVIDILNIVLTLAIVVVIVYIAVRLLKKFSGSPVDDFGVIEIMASKGIAQGIAIYIIRIGKDYYVMSTGDRGLNLLTKIEDKELINILNVEKSKHANEIKEDFIDAFLSLFRKKSKDEIVGENISDERINFLKQQKKKLKEWE